MAGINLPPIPDGYVLDNASALPPIPDGYQLEGHEPAPITASGTATALGAGAATGIANLPSDFIGLGNLIRKIDPLNLPGMVQDQVAVPGILKKLSQKADELYTPKNSFESGAKTVGEYLPAVATGPEGLMSKGVMGVPKILASRAIRQAAIPTAAAEAAGAATEGTDAEPYARLAAGIVAGGLAGGKDKLPVRTSDEVAAAAKRYGDAFNASPVTINANHVENAANQIKRQLQSAGIYRDTPVERLLEPYLDGNHAPIPLQKLQDTRSMLSDARSGDKTANTAATLATRTWDQMMGNLQPTSVVSGAQHLPQAMSDLMNLRAAHAVRKQMELVEDKGFRAENRRLSTYSGDNGDNTLRQHLASLRNLQDPRLAPYDADLGDIIKGNTTVNTARRLGNIGHGLGSFLIPLGFMDAGLTGGLGTAAAVGGGVLLKRMAAAHTFGKYDALLNKIAAKAPGLSAMPSNNSIIRKLSNAARGAYDSQQ